MTKLTGFHSQRRFLVLMAAALAVSSLCAEGFGQVETREAESGTLIPGKNGHLAGIVKRPEASGGAVIEYFTDQSGIEFEDVKESNRIVLNYASCSSGSDSVVDIYVNDEKEPSVSIPYQGTGQWTAPYKKVEADVYIPEGATVKVVSRKNSINVDSIEFNHGPLRDKAPAGILPAASEKLVGGASARKDMMANGGRTVLIANGEDAVEFDVPAEKLKKMNTAIVRFSAEKGEEVKVLVNGGKASVKQLPSTGKNRYEEFVIDGLTPGKENTIRIQGTKPGSVLIDEMSFCYLAPVTPSPALDMPPAGSERKEISLNGVWECTTTPDTADAPPGEYDNRMPVPGLWDIAGRDLGKYDGKSLWYRKTVNVGKVPDRVTLDVRKAQFGRYIYINGKLVDEYTYNFTPSRTDITKYLIPDAENEIVIRLQNCDYQKKNPKSLGHLGYDGERKYYWPGIYDDVNLVASSNPVVDYLQVAPDIDKGGIRARVFLKNTTSGEVKTPVTFNIYKLGVVKDGKEPKSPELVATHTVENVTLPANGEHIVDVPEIMLRGYDKVKDLWSPDSPNLYRMVVNTAGDTLTKRFGMRTFRFDADTKLPVLNGKPHYLRGTNIVFNRFCDDPMRKDLPWQKGWARELYKEFKKVNFESFRTHSAFLPDNWYDLADEMGFLIMDEYPFWQHCDGDDCNAETLTPEIKVWMMERGMHPSVVVWDIQNESFQPWLMGVLDACRSLDIQNRPGDCGWNNNTCKTDMKESHPYFYSEGDFTLGYMNNISHIPWTFGNKSEDLPLVINEYGWNWLNREGDPTGLGKASYDFILPGSTREERISYQADSLAELTEFWRVGRKCVGILQFCGLSYSLPGQEGATGDILQPDITTPRIRPYVAERLKEAFSSLGLAIEDYTENVLMGQTMTIPVTMINDLNEEVEGQKVRLRLYQDGKVLFDESKEYNAAPISLASQNFTVKVPEKLDAQKRDLKLVAEYVRNGEKVRSIRNWKAEDRAFGIAFRKPVTASSYYERTYYHMFQAPNANDGASNTRWHSGKDDKAPWITIDLGEKKDISRILLDWSEVLGKKYYAGKYEIQVSDDGENFKKVYDGSAKTSGAQVFDINGSGRYVRMQVTGDMPEGECALWEFDVWSK